MSSDSPKKQVFRVNIFNQSLSISSSSSAEDFQRVADQVDHLMGMIASKSGTSDGTRVGVLAAMHLADRLYQAQRELAAGSSELAEAAARASATEASLSGTNSELEHTRELLESIRGSHAETAQTIEQLKRQLLASKEAHSALQAELASARGSLAAAQAEIETQRSRIGRDAGRLHHMLEQALDGVTATPPTPKQENPESRVRAMKTQDMFSFDETGGASESPA